MSQSLIRRPIVTELGLIQLKLVYLHKLCVLEDTKLPCLNQFWNNYQVIFSKTVSSLPNVFDIEFDLFSMVILCI